jgi:hypothetical protein
MRFGVSTMDDAMSHAPFQNSAMPALHVDGMGSGRIASRQQK